MKRALTARLLTGIGCPFARLVPKSRAPRDRTRGRRRRVRLRGGHLTHLRPNLCELSVVEPRCLLEEELQRHIKALRSVPSNLASTRGICTRTRCIQCLPCLRVSNCQKVRSDKSYSLYRPPLMDAIGDPKAPGPLPRSIRPGRVSGRSQSSRPLHIQLTGGGSTKSPLGKGSRMKTVNCVSPDLLSEVILWRTGGSFTVWSGDRSLRVNQ